jgi:hypothetical protein
MLSLMSVMSPRNCVVVYGCDRDARGWSSYPRSEAETKLCTFLIGNDAGSAVPPLAAEPSQDSAIEAA